MYTPYFVTNMYESCYLLKKLISAYKYYFHDS
jgi:hypothetical protein